MKMDQASRTAQYMALFRALESNRASGKRLFNDPYAMLFLTNGFKRVVRFAGIPLFKSIIQQKIRKRIPGGYSSGVARTRYIDDLLQQTIQQGAKQVIILGAGYDTRALRLDFLQDVPVIEIDHPNTAKDKVGLLQQALGKLPANVRYYQIDFNEQHLDDLAAQRHLNLSIPTTIIWEGVTNYLSEQAIDSTFSFASKLPPGSHIIFTYVHSLIFDDPKAFYGAEKLLNDLAEIEEHWTFGFDPDELPAYLQRYQYTLVEDLGATEYRARYIPNRTERGYEFYRAAIARKIS